MLGKKIYLVGGAVRDTILGFEVKDKDYVAVGYKDEDFKHLKKVGKDFSVFLREDGSELALARQEKKIAKGYNGFEMNTNGVTLEDDLSRRDLTINSIAFDQEVKGYIDPFNGLDDIKRKTLRHISPAFTEDPLRVLRVARFRATFGISWKIHHSTKVLVYQMRDELKSLQKDRVYKEIEKVLKLKESHIFFETMFELGVLDIVFPNIYSLTTLKEGSIYHLEGSVFIHTMQMLKLSQNSSPLIKLSILFHDIAKPHCYRVYGNSAGHEKVELVESRIDFEIPTKLKKAMLFLIKYHIKISLINEMSAKKLATFLESFKKDKQLLEDLIKLYKVDNQERETLYEKEKLDFTKVLKIFDMISEYSPKKWISEQKEPPKGEVIAMHIHNKNISFVKKIMGNVQ